MSEKVFQNVTTRAVTFGQNQPLALIAGCCAIESREKTLSVCRELKAITESLGVPFVFKASYDKANRNSIDSYRGPGMEEGLDILREVKATFNVPILTDVHSEDHIDKAAQVADILQIPAFLSRQTDLLVAAARSGRVINIKKGQFMAPLDIVNSIGKIVSTGNRQILLTERGVSFGYNHLISDMTALPIMRSLGYPVIYDATHSVQTPAGQGGKSGGRRAMIPFLARAACAVGIDALFMEVHDDPDSALCDGPNSMNLKDMEPLLRVCRGIAAMATEDMRRLEDEAG